jgi:hypothetical protein
VAQHVKIYCEIKYERGNGPGKGFVARFFRKRDQVQVGAAFWNKKTRTFDNVRGIGGNALLPAEVQCFTTMVPDSLRCKGFPWYSHKDPYAE